MGAFGIRVYIAGVPVGPVGPVAAADRVVERGKWGRVLQLQMELSEAINSS